MSGVVKAVGKVFTAVWKVVKVVAPIVLGVAAVIFTAGAAIPALAGTVLGGGLGGAVAGLTTSLGLSGTLGAAVTGAITYAGYGAATGAITAAVTGGDVLKGAQTGALTGAALGGIGGATGIIAPSTPTWGPNAPIPDAINITGPQPYTGPQPDGAAGGAPTPTGSAPTGAAPAPTAAQGSSGGLLGKGGWVERNGALAGNLLQGIGGAFDKDPGEYMLERERMYGENYKGGGGLLTKSDVPSVPGLRPPTDAFAAARPVPTASQGSAYGFEYQWSPKEGRIIKVPNVQQGA